MTIISLIVAIDENRGMGKDNNLLCHLPADLRHFKQLTLGKPIVMGRKTYNSIGKPLPGRLNIVLSKHVADIPGVTVVNSLSRALELVRDAPETMIIGGSAVFEQALPLAERLYLTIIHHQFVADVFFPKLDMAGWELCAKSDWAHDETNQYDMTFCHYERSLSKMNSGCTQNRVDSK